MALMSKFFVIILIAIILFRRWPLLLDFATISRTMIISTSRLLSSDFIKLLIYKVYQSFDLCDGFIDSIDFFAFQLRPSPNFQPIHEVEQHIFCHEVRNMKCEDSELFQVH